MNFLGYIIIGALAGWLAGKIMRGQGYGILGNIIVGIIGGVVGGWVFGFLGFQTTNTMGSFITAVIGAILSISIVRLLSK